MASGRRSQRLDDPTGDQSVFPASEAASFTSELKRATPAFGAAGLPKLSVFGDDAKQDVAEWLNLYGLLAAVANIPANGMHAHLQFFLQGRPAAVAARAIKKAEQDNKQPYFEEAKKALIQAFGKVRTPDVAFAMLAQLQQDEAETGQDFIGRFEQILHDAEQAGLELNDQTMMLSFTRALTRAYSEAVTRSEAANYYDAKAVVFREDIIRKNKRFGTKTRDPEVMAISRMDRSDEIRALREEVKQLRQMVETLTLTSNPTKECYSCGEKGHRARFCPRGYRVYHFDEDEEPRQRRGRGRGGRR